MTQMCIINRGGSTNKLAENIYGMSNICHFDNKIDNITNNMMVSRWMKQEVWNDQVVGDN